MIIMISCIVVIIVVLFIITINSIMIITIGKFPFNVYTSTK